MIKAAIFDMDGLLIDSEQFWRDSYIEVLGGHGFVITEDDVKEKLGSGLRTSDEIDIWHSIFNWGKPSKEEMARQVHDKVTSHLRLKGEALPGVHDLIDLLHEHQIPMAIASSSSIEHIEIVVESLSLKNITHIRSGEQEILGKPHPDIFLSTARKLGVSPGDCLVFEDSLNGVKAAKAAGMKCIAVPKAPFDASSFDIADVVTSNLKEVSWKTIQSL